MPHISRLQQIAVAEEATENTAVADASLYVAANAKYEPIDPVLEYDLPLYERRTKRESLTPRRGLAGVQMAIVRFGVELQGMKPVTNPAAFNLLMRACGFRQFTSQRFTIGAVTGGPFLHGELVTQTGTGAQGIVQTTVYDGQTSMYISIGAPFGNGTLFNGTGLLTGSTSGATATPSAVTTQGKLYTWSPFSHALTTLTTNASGLGVGNDLAKGDVVKGQTSGAQGIVFYAHTGAAAASSIYIRRQSGHFTAGEAVDRISPTTDTSYFTLDGTTPESQFQIPSLTIGALYDGVRQAITGARGNVQFTANVGEPCIAQFEFRGALGAATDGANIDGIVTGLREPPPIFLDSDMSIGGESDTFAQEVTPCVASMSLNMNNNIIHRRCSNDPTGLLETIITGRTPGGQMDPELQLEGVYPWVTNYIGNITNRFRFRVGNTNNNKYLFEMPGMVFSGMPIADRDGLTTRSVSFNLDGGEGDIAVDNELVLSYEIP